MKSKRNLLSYLLVALLIGLLLVFSVFNANSGRIIKDAFGTILFELGVVSPYPLLMPSKSTPSKVTKSKKISGFILLSYLDSVSKVSKVSLYDLERDKFVKDYELDWDVIIDLIPTSKDFGKPSKLTARAFHPFLDPNGNLWFNTYGALIKYNSNEHKYYLINKGAHHSIVFSDDLNAVVFPSSKNDYLSSLNDYLSNNMIDDYINIYQLDGTIIFQKSISELLIENGYSSFLFGRMGSKFEADPIHTNYIDIAHNKGIFWDKGDLLISARNLSAIILYRPSTNKVIKLIRGPWTNQHYAKFRSNNSITMFNNNAFGFDRKNPDESNFVNDDDYSEFIEVFFNSNGESISVSHLDGVFEKYNIKSVTEGLAEFLTDDLVFIEDGIFGRVFIFDKFGELLWFFNNRYNDDDNGITSWSRYYDSIPYID